MTDENDIKNNPLLNEVLHRLLGSIDYVEYVKLPDFGVYCLSIKEAAELATIDMWWSGVYEHDEPKDFNANYYCPTLRPLLAKEIDELTQKLTISAEQGKLKLEYECIDFESDKIIPERTFIEIEELERWLEKREYLSGDAIHEWIHDKADLIKAIEDEVRFSKLDPELYKKTHNLYSLNILKGEPEDEATNLLEAKQTIRELAAYNKALLGTINNHKKEKAERPVSTSQRRTLLTIIAALCDYSEIDPQARGAGQRIAEMTQKIGADITAETINKYLGEIPDAVESRMK